MRYKIKDLILVFLQILLFFFILLAPFKQIDSTLVVFAGLALSTIGLLVVLVSLWQLRRYSLTAVPTPVKNAKLRTSGMYAISRHPIYSGILVTFSGLAITAPSVLRTLALLTLLALFLYKARYEDRLLAKKFGQAYKTYQSNTGMFIPFVHGGLKIYLGLQTLALAAGNYVGWSTIFKEVNTYCNQHSGNLWSLTDFSGSITGNPLISPCFWGSIVFIIAFAWAISLLFEKNIKKVRSHLNKMWWLLLGGTIFALVNNIPIIYKFYTRPIGSFASCSAGTVTNPYITSCFLGFSFFLLAFIFATSAKHSAK